MSLIHVLQIASDHPGDQQLLCRHCHVDLAGHAAVTDDHNAVCNLEELLQLVRNIENRNTLRSCPVDELEQMLGLHIVQRACGFVHNQHLDVVGDDLRQLDELLLCN